MGLEQRSYPEGFVIFKAFYEENAKIGNNSSLLSIHDHFLVSSNTKETKTSTSGNNHQKPHKLGGQVVGCHDNC